MPSQGLRGSDSAKEATAVREVWRASVKHAKAVPELRRCILELEALLRAQQEQPDIGEVDSASSISATAAATAAADAAAAAAAVEERKAQGWSYDSSVHSVIDQRVRLFTAASGSSSSARSSAAVEGRVIAIRPARVPAAPAAVAVSGKGKRKAAAVKPSSSERARPAKWLLQLDSGEQQEVGEAALALYMRYSSEGAIERDRDAEDAVEAEEEVTNTNTNTVRCHSAYLIVLMFIIAAML
jgi:hypothetical protein